MSERLSLVIVEDEVWKREGMVANLAAHGGFEILAAVNHDEAFEWPRSRWSDIDVALVDVYDDHAPGEVGTDLYSGIRVVERMRDLPIRCVAITPSCAHPLVQLRLTQAAPDFCYHRYELRSLDVLATVLAWPDRARRPAAPDPHLLRRLGARELRANELVSAFETSPLHRVLRSTSGLKELSQQGVGRRAVNRSREIAVECGYLHFDTLDKESQAHYLVEELPRWPVIRDLILTLLGRLDAPWSEHDHPWWAV